MKQIIQNLKTGETTLEEVPAPGVRRGHVLIQTSCSLVSLGTERMLVEFGKANLIDKARQQPEKVKQVLDKVRSDGLMPTIDAVRNKLGQPLPLGYCNVGIVQESRNRINRRLTQTDEDLSPAEPAGEKEPSLHDKKGENYGTVGDSTSHLHNFSASGFKKGDRVVSNGPHAEIVCVPKNLCAKIPLGVEDEEAAFTVMGAIGSGMGDVGKAPVKTGME